MKKICKGCGDEGKKLYKGYCSCCVRYEANEVERVDEE